MNNPQSITTFARRKYNGHAGRHLCTVSQPAASWCWPGELLSNIRTPFQGRCGMATPPLNKAAKSSKPCWGFGKGLRKPPAQPKRIQSNAGCSDGEFLYPMVAYHHLRY